MPGLAEHGRGFKDLADGIALRNHVLQRLEAASAGGAESELGFVFVGAGYAGVEALAELNDLAHAALRYYPSLRDVKQRWVLVDAAPTILADIPRRLGTYAARKLERRGVEIHVNETLASYDGATALLSGGTAVPARTLVWTAGVKAVALAPEFGLPLDERGRVRVDATLRVEGLDDVWSLGDCAAVPNTRTPGQTDPPTCQHALRQARRLAKNLGGDPQPYSYRMLGQVATLGRYKGIADVMGMHVSGFLGWFIARTYHLYALPLFSRKARVVADWTTSLFFRRDIAELSSLGHPEGLEPVTTRRALFGLRVATPRLDAPRRNHRRGAGARRARPTGHPPARRDAVRRRLVRPDGLPGFLEEFAAYHREGLTGWTRG